MFAPHGFVAGRDLEIGVARASIAFPSPTPEWTEIGRRVVAGRPDLLLVNYYWVEVLQPLTRDIPIVFVGMVDPEYHGSIASARQPGGNVTGALIPFFELQEKRIQLLRELRPDARRVVVVFNPVAYATRIEERIKALARRFNMDGAAIAVADSMAPGRVADAVRAARADLADLLIADQQMHPDTFRQLTQLGVATSCSYRGSVRSGALLAYEVAETEQIAVALAARILRGEPVATLPAQQAQNFSLALNERTARALKLRFPPSLLVSAHEVVE
ncbi:MAG TPA: ABC transporter substrate binding protein [Usitatibacter sp.]|nr:ABC transporter substrate binding protein [Usitatibacter sp.]